MSDSRLANYRIEIVIDGMNLARSRENDCPWLPVDDAAAVLECIQFFINSGADTVKVFGATRWCESSESLKKIQASGLLFSAPGGLDDGFMLDYANRKGAFVVSNDRFLDHLAPHGIGYDPSWVLFHRLPYMWEPEFSVDQSALHRVAAYQAGRSPPEFAAGRALSSSSLSGKTPNSAVGSHTNTPGVLGNSPSETGALPPAFGIAHPRESGCGGGSGGGGGAGCQPGEWSLPGGQEMVDENEDGGDSSWGESSLRVGGCVGSSATAATVGLGCTPAPPPPLPPSAVTASSPTGASAAAATCLHESVLTEVVQVPRGAVGRIIGSGGQNIKALEASTGCRVSVSRREEGGGRGGGGGGGSGGTGYRQDGTFGALRPQEDEEEVASVTIRGPPEALALAKAAVFSKVRLFQAHGSAHGSPHASNNAAQPHSSAGATAGLSSVPGSAAEAPGACTPRPSAGAAVAGSSRGVGFGSEMDLDLEMFPDL